MSPRLPRITAARLLRALRRDGWLVERHSGSHVLLRHPTRPGRVIVPRHAGTIIKAGTLSSILDEAGLSADEMRDLL